MSLFDRFRGRDDNGQEVAKLPIWPTISTVAEILSNQLTDAQAIARWNLNALEQAEYWQIKTKINADITNIATALITAGVNSDVATTIAKSTVRNSFTQILMRAELGYDDREEFNTALGIS